MLISLTKWAKRVGIDSSVARRKAYKKLIPAQKIGREWLIEENTPNIDNRIKSGKYINWRKQKTTQ